MNIATQHWLCRSLQWFCDGGGHGYAGPAPEIGDMGALVGGLTLAAAALLYISNRPRRRR